MQHIILEDHLNKNANSRLQVHLLIPLLTVVNFDTLDLNMRDKSLQHSQKKQKVRREFKLHPCSVHNK